jgi:putative ABC transport system permease protein
MDGLLKDVVYGWRTLRKSPAFTAVAVIVLALGIGANTAIFSVVDAVLLRPLPFQNPGRLVAVWEDASHVGFPENTPAPANFIDWRKQNNVFTDMAALAGRAFTLNGEAEPEKVEGYVAAWNVFPLLGVKPELGRTFLAEEDRADGPRVVLLSDGLWKRRFGGDPSIVGRDIRINGAKVKVVGVMPPTFHFPERETELWAPLAFSEQEWASRGSHFLFVIARLKSHVTLEKARADMSVIAQRLAHQYPDNDADLGVRVVPLQEQFVGASRRGLVVLLVAVGCVLLIACANVANLLLARTAGRIREIAMRTILGASGIRVARQLLTENLLLAGTGGLLGVVLAFWGFGFLKQLIPADLSLDVLLQLDLRVLGFTLVATALTGMLFGLAPALQGAHLNLNDALKAGGARAGFGGRNPLRNSLVVFDVALTVVLLVGAVLLLRSFVNLRGIDPGFRSSGVLTLRLVLPESKYPDAGKRATFFDQVVEKLNSLPGVKGVAFTSALPLVWKGGTNSFVVEGRPRPADNLPYDANDRVVSPSYMQVMGMTLRAGRFFDRTDGPQSQPVAIINETMARMYFPGQNALSKRIKYSDYYSPRPWITIVGIVKDVKQMGLDVPSRPEMYYPYRQALYNWMVPRDIVIRADEPMTLVAAARQRIWEVDPGQPVSNITTLDDILDDELQQRRVQAFVLGAFSALAIMLACVGIYGLLSYLVSQRTQEIGVRIALGAQPSQILRAVMGRGLLLAIVGVAIGLAATVILTRLLESLLFGVAPRDPLTLFAVSATLLFVGSAASFIPARRAMRVDPMTALRNE